MHLLGEGLRLAAAGIACGLVASLLISRALSGLLFGITAADPLTYLAIGVLLLAVALAASYLPARRALRIDPVKALAP
jgi:ABC-type antimicrobial peptide transport system permease subunit